MSSRAPGRGPSHARQGGAPDFSGGFNGAGPEGPETAEAVPCQAPRTYTRAIWRARTAAVTDPYALARAAYAEGWPRQDTPSSLALLDARRLPSGRYALPPGGRHVTTASAVRAVHEWIEHARAKRGGPRPGSGRPKGARNAAPSRAGIAISVRVTQRAREILRQDERPGELISLLVERYAASRELRPSAPARPADDGQDAGPVVDPHDA